MDGIGKKVISFIRTEAVLSAAALLAVVSAFFVHPDEAYIGYIDFRTLAILFCLMTVMAGLRRQGVFDRLGHALLSRAHGQFSVLLVLVLLCFFCSMIITNDVSLITFVPFTFVVLDMLGSEMRAKWAVTIVCMQTIAANLGSMLTPIGNPQNLYLYGKGGQTVVQFLLLMLPYAALSLIMLILWLAVLCRIGKDNAPAIAEIKAENAELGNEGNKKLIALYLVLFILCLLVVARLVSYSVIFIIVLAAVLLFDRNTVRGVDYSLLLTFVAFFIFIGNLGRLPAFSAWLKSVLAGREVLIAVLASQVTSNVPAALLLSGFTDNTAALIIGTDLGGLGTLIASMASLISYRQVAQNEPQRKGEYFKLFTISNVVFLAVLMVLWLIMAAVRGVG